MKSKIDVVWPEPKPLDHFMLRDVFNELDFSPVGSLEYNILDDFSQATGDGVVYVANGTNNKAEELNEILAKYKWVLLIIISDEENLFEIDKVDHPNIKIWLQTPRADKEYENVRFFGVGYGYAPQFRKEFTQQYLDKPVDLFISGQNTHARRELIFDALWYYKEENPNEWIDIRETKGFTQGMEPRQYYYHMISSKIAPAPSGIVSPDSFRLYEALEMGTVPIADDVSPRVGYDSRGYWNKIFPDAPFPILQDDDICSLLDEAKEDYQNKANHILAWWIAQKRRYAYELVEDIRSLAGLPMANNEVKDKITIVMPVSPWKSHPSTEVLDASLRSARAQLPDAEIIVTFDGVREEQKDKTESYQEFIKRALWKINTEHKNVLPILFDEHEHQSGMMREALKHIKTEYVLYLEGDMSFYDDRIVPWTEFLDILEAGKANILRIHFEATIPEPHEYLMLHDRDMKVGGNSYIGTIQWSQRPHLMRTSLYRDIMENFFSPDAKCFIEDKFYGSMITEYQNGNWDKWKMFIFLPESGLNMAYHLDGRDGETKYDDRQIW